MATPPDLVRFTRRLFTTRAEGQAAEAPAQAAPRRPLPSGAEKARGRAGSPTRATRHIKLIRSRTPPYPKGGAYSVVSLPKFAAIDRHDPSRVLPFL